MLFSQEIFEGYTLFSSSRLRDAEGAITYLIDNDYNNIQYKWGDNNDFGPNTFQLEPKFKNPFKIH